MQVFDGHNDSVLRMWRAGAEGLDAFRAGGPGHVTAPAMRAGGMVGGLFALFVPDDSPVDMADFSGAYDIPLATPVAETPAARVALEQAAILVELDRRGDLALCRTRAEIDAAIAAGRPAAVMHLEGAEPIDPDLAMLDRLHEKGLRSLGPVWSRSNAFGHGVPFRYPSDGDTGPGLTEAGRRLVARCAELGMVVDCSHLTEKGFWQIAEAGLPVVASHSNAHAVCPHARNLSDAQLRAVGESGGIVGLNLAAAFLRPDGQMNEEGAFAWILPHLDRMVEMAGEDHVGIGTDFDGATIPREIGSAAGLPVMVGAMREAGYGENLIERICHRNWLDLIGRVCS